MLRLPTCVLVAKKRKKERNFKMRIILIIKNRRKNYRKEQKSREKFYKGIESVFLL